MPGDDFFRPYGPLPARRRLLIAALAVVTALGVIWLLLDTPGRAPRPKRAAPADVANCAPGQTDACVGSTTRVLPAAAQAAGRASSGPAPLP
jgi:hypothetical protein